ncbi:MAG TPA: DUF1800 domain-containing protein [Pirellulales bacterium]|nr:DUF1800 domain-containing protein [Pirellulales bacterium]
MFWQPYQPDDKAPWNLRRAAHLHRRAGFAAAGDELQQDLKDGPRAAVDRLLAGKGHASGAPDDFEATSRLLAEAAVASGNIHRLKAWWLYRMMFSPDPLGERLTLMWHNHFATSNRKLQDAAMMRRQNDLFRTHARGKFADLLFAVVKDPAMLVWLDADSNRREHPNENLARELMELFTLGVGNYTETDVKEAARALTGWTVKSREFREVAAYRDDGEKTILGRQGAWRGDDLLALLLEQPATSVRLARRVCELLMGEGAVDEPAIDELAAGLREHELDIGWAVETVLRSAAFFDDKNIGNRVLGPVEFVVGAVRALELLDPPPSTIVLAEWTAALGQDLFEPPNVFGWAGGRAWINTRSLIARANFAQRLADGGLQNAAAPPDWLKLAERRGCGDSADAFAGFLVQMLSATVADDEHKRIKQAALAEETLLTPRNAVRLVAATLASPGAQLG